MGEMVLLGFLVALSLVALILRLGPATCFGYGAALDLAAMGLLALLFHGTFAGMTVALIGGLFFSLAIYVWRRERGYRTWSPTRGWIVVEPDPLPRPPKLHGRLALVKLWAMTYCAVTTLLLMMVGSVTGVGVALAAPLVLVMAVPLTAALVRRIK